MKKNKDERLKKTFYKATGVKTVWYWHNEGQIYQWTRIEIPERDPCLHDQLAFYRDLNAIQPGKGSFQQLKQVEIHGGETSEPQPSLTAHTQIVLRWMTDVNVKS